MRTDIKLVRISDQATRVEMATYGNAAALVGADLQVTQSQTDVDRWAARFEAYVAELSSKSVA
jgi:hypothetical protein